jgi:O-antigen/teichoic acid export membrane protein
MVIRMLRTLSTNADNFLIGITIGPVALGYYVIAYRVMVVINELLALALTPVILSMFSRLQDDLPALNSAFYRTSGLVTALGFPVYAGLALVARPLITLVFGAKWGPSVPVMRVLTIAGLAQVQMVFTGQYMLALGRYSSELRWTTGLVAAELIGFGVTVQFGIVPVAASLGVVLAMAWPLRLLWLRGAGGISLKAYFSPYRSVLAATIAMAAAVFLVGRLLIHSGRLPLLVAEILVGIGVYLGVFVALARSTAAEVLTMVKRLRG